MTLMLKSQRNRRSYITIWTTTSKYKIIILTLINILIVSIHTIISPLSCTPRSQSLSRLLQAHFFQLPRKLLERRTCLRSRVSLTFLTKMLSNVALMQSDPKRQRVNYKQPKNFQMRKDQTLSLESKKSSPPSAQNSAG